MQIRVPYGTGYQEAYIDESKVDVEIIDPPLAVPAESIEAIIEDALDNPVGTPRLEDMAGPDDKITIIVNDHTRPGPNAEMCSAIVRRLNAAGVPDEHLLFVVATGCHKGPTDEQLHEILGGLEKRIRVHNHDCLDGEHVLMGTTSTNGVPVYLDKYVAESDFIVTTGVITPHHIAGFSGGRKSIVPGVVSFDTLRKHHSLPVMPYEPAFNNFEDNIFHKIALEAAKLVKVRFILNVVQDHHKQPAYAVAGDLEAAHLRGVELCRQANTVDVHGRAQLIIASPGGFPRDMDLWQSQKALSVAEVISDPEDVTFILCAEGKKGMPQLFIDWMSNAASPEAVIERFRTEGFAIGSVKAFLYARALTKGRIILVTEGFDADQADQVMMDWAPDLQTAIDTVMQEKSPEKIKVIPRAVNIIPRIV
ncbi:MAG: nickel-dependent lactate racemase [Mogibacterium sp.]|nr:nickel-dependent lactate racemase [Mogibacterium sp.]